MIRTGWRPHLWMLALAAAVVFALGMLVVARPALVLVPAILVVLGVVIQSVPKYLILPFGICGAIFLVVFAAPGVVGPGLVSLLFPPVGAFCLCVYALRRSDVRITYPAGFRLASAAFLIAFMSTVLLENTEIYYASTAIVGLVVYVAASNLDRSGVALVKSGLILMGLTLSVLGSVERYVVQAPLMGRYSISLGENTILGGVRAQATLGAPVVLGFVILVCLVVLVSSTIFSWPVRAMLSSLLLFGIATSGTASALVVAILMIPLSIFSRSGMSAKLLAVGLAIVGWLVVFGFRLIPEGILDGVTSKLEGQNTIHRSNSLNAIPNLVDAQSFDRILFGNGWGSARYLYETGVFVEDGFYAIDNYFAWSLSVFGIVGSALIAAFFWTAFVRGARTGKALIVACLIMGFSFDFMAWVSSTAILFCVFGLAMGDRSGGRYGKRIGSYVEAEPMNATQFTR